MSITRFTVEFATPSKEQVAAVACPYIQCKAKAGKPCVASRYNGKAQRQVTGPIKHHHHDRVAAAIGLRVVQSCTIYRYAAAPAVRVVELTPDNCNHNREVDPDTGECLDCGTFLP